MAKKGSGERLAEREATGLASRSPESTGSFESPFSAFECQERLLEALESDDDGVDIYGDVSMEGFELHRGTRVRAGSHPVLTGRFSPSNGATQIEYRLGRSKSSQPYMRIAAVIWAIMAFSWVIFFVYWLVDPDGIDIELPRLLLLLGIVLLMGATIVAGRRTDAQGGADLLDFVMGALAPDEVAQRAESPVQGRLEKR